MTTLTEFIPYIIILVIFVIGVILLIIRRSRKKKTLQIIQSDNQTEIINIKNQLNIVRDNLLNLPRSAEVDLISEKINSIESNFMILNEDVTMKLMNADTTIKNMTAQHTELLNSTEKRILKETTEKIMAQTSQHIADTSVNKEEFDRLKSRIETLIGAEIDATRLYHLKQIFGDTARKDVLTWKCKTINLLKGGLAPVAEEDTLVTEGITLSKSRKFLKELRDMGVVTEKKIESYWLNDDFQWLHKYMNDVELLVHRIEQIVKNEKNYENYIKDNITEIENDLIFQEQQYSIDSENRIDLVYRDKSGSRLFIELKYPKAKQTDKFQLVRYRETIRAKDGVPSDRYMLIAPSIPIITQESLITDDFEFKEITF